MSLWSALNYVVVDVEGNGRQPADLLEVGCVPITGAAIGAPVSWLLKPARSITPFATRIHGVKNEDVAEAPALSAVEHDVLAALEGGDAVIAHNAHIDINVLTRELPGWCPREVFDTLKLARRLAPGLPSYKLGALVEEFGLAEGLPPGLAPHRVTYDVLVTGRLFVRLMSQSPYGQMSLEQLRGAPVEEGTGALF